MQYKLFLASAGLGLLSFVSRPAIGATISTTIGSQHFTDGQVVGSAVFAAAVSGQPAPFDAIIGSDIVGPNFSGAWTFHYTLAAGESITSASIAIGVWDGDSQAAGNQVGSFTLNNTVDLTAPLNAAFEGHGGATGEYDVYRATIPVSAFASLAGGSATFSLALAAPGLGVLGATDFNGAGLDFSTLQLATSTPVTTPEPATWGMLAAGAALIAIGRRRFHRRQDQSGRAGNA
jgi:PEP-CTERM motif